MALHNQVQCAPCVTPPPPPVDIDIINCDGTVTTETFEVAPQKVEIVQTKPFVICKGGVDFEVGCSSIDGRIVVRSYVQDDAGVITSQVFEQDGVTPVTDGSILVACNGKDIEDVESCFQDITDNSITYKQVIFVDTSTQVVIASIWLDANGVAIATPTNIEPCKEAKINGSVAVQTDCTTTTIENYSDTVKAVIGHVVEVKEVCKLDEIDYIHTNWLPICVAGVQWYVAEEYSYNNTTETKTLIGKIYKQGANGATTTVAPIGVITDGSCPCIAIPQGVLVNW